MHGALLLATAMATRTRTIRIGFSVLVLPLYQPIRLAEENATLDLLSGGRVDFGISRGSTGRYFEAWGLDHADRTTSFRETLDMVLRCWTEPTIDVAGVQESVEPKPVQRPHPPVYVAAYGEETAAWVGSAGYRLMQGGIQSPDSLGRCLRAFADAGGDVATAPVGRIIYASETDASARREVWPALLQLTAHFRRGGFQLARNLATSEQLEPDRWFDEMAIIGSPETCARKIAELRDTIGIGYVNCQTAFWSLLPEEHMRSSLELLASEVLPRLNGAGRTPTSHDGVLSPSGAEC